MLSTFLTSISNRSIRSFESADLLSAFEAGSAVVEVVWFGAVFVVLEVCATALSGSEIDRRLTKANQSLNEFDKLSYSTFEALQTVGRLAFIQSVLGGMWTIGGREW